MEKGIKIIHNRKLFLVIILLIVILIILIWFIVQRNAEEINCVPACGCHSSDCIPENEALNCPAIFCTQECQPGTLDCGQGSCEYDGEKCIAVFK